MKLDVDLSLDAPSIPSLNLGENAKTIDPDAILSSNLQNGPPLEIPSGIIIDALDWLISEMPKPDPAEARLPENAPSPSKSGAPGNNPDKMAKDAKGREKAIKAQQKDIKFEEYPNDSDGENLKDNKEKNTQEITTVERPEKPKLYFFPKEIGRHRLRFGVMTETPSVFSPKLPQTWGLAFSIRFNFFPN